MTESECIQKVLPFSKAGVDILNPVQYSAADIDLVELKKRFGKNLISWCGGINTQ